MSAANAQVLVLGSGELPAALVEALREGAVPVVHLRKPADRDVVSALRSAPRFVAVISHDDIEALRLALVAEHARPGVRMLVTIFDRTVAAQVRRAVPNCDVVSLGDAAAPVLAEDCVGSEHVPPSRLRRRLELLSTQLRAFDISSRLLLGGVAGLLVILLGQAVLAAAVFDEAPLDALYESAKAVATVGPDAAAEHGPDWYRAVATAAMLTTTALTAAATAGLINRLVSRRLVAIVGRRTLPRRDHVIVVGLGQVGLRLCLLLQRLGVRSVVIERDGDAPNVHLAKRLGIPVVTGDGTERGLLERLGARRARALATVTSDDRVNIAASVAALAVREDLRVVLRAGDDDAASETRALFPIGVVRDVNRLAAARFAELALEGDSSPPGS
jgi:voltage-gated potassium channel Kch